MNCQTCNRLMLKTGRSKELIEFDEEFTEGQMADYLAAEESGNYDEWEIGVVRYYCKNCDKGVEIQSEDLKSITDLILKWHIKANEETDYFASFVFEYLAFAAHLKNNLYPEEERDRLAIQSLKRSTETQAHYLRKVSESEELKECWENVIQELKSNPLCNTSKDFDHPEIDIWWNSIDNHPDIKSSDQKGIIKNLEDWPNMIEYWNSVRNNLFHGGKHPDFLRDCFLVEYAFKTLRAFMDIETKRFYRKS